MPTSLDHRPDLVARSRLSRTVQRPSRAFHKASSAPPFREPARKALQSWLADALPDAVTAKKSLREQFQRIQRGQVPTQASQAADETSVEARCGDALSRLFLALMPASSVRR
jgi:hypothetical protein